jgi:hypothetical protein
VTLTVTAPYLACLLAPLLGFRGFYANWRTKGKENLLPLKRVWAKTNAKANQSATQ